MWPCWWSIRCKYFFLRNFLDNILFPSREKPFCSWLPTWLPWRHMGTRYSRVDWGVSYNHRPRPPLPPLLPKFDTSAFWPPFKILYKLNFTNCTFSPTIRIAHSSSGTVLRIRLNRLSCAKFEHCSTIGNRRPLVAHVTVDPGTWPWYEYSPELGLCTPHVARYLLLKIRLLLSAKNFQYLFNRCMAKSIQFAVQTSPSRSAILFGYKVLKARLHSDSRESAGTSYVMHSKFLSSTSRWFQRRFLVHLLLLFNFKKEFLKMIGWQNTRNALGKLEELLTCKIWWVFPAWGFVYFLR